MGKKRISNGFSLKERDMTKRLNTFAVMLLTLPALVKRDEEGQTLAEYALILALIAVAVVAVVGFLGGSIKDIFSNITTSL
jgi:pilus assembly protein Flp/PilA